MMSKRFRDSSLFKDKEAFERLKCPYCKQLLHSPVQPCCGHRLCQLCADDILNNGSRDPPRCPLVYCQEEFILEDGEAYFPDRFVRREIQALKMFCQFHGDGCNWEGTLAEYDTHIVDCSYSTKATKTKWCPLKPLGCSNEVAMEDNELREHLLQSEYNHLTMLANCYQLLSQKVSKLHIPTRMKIVDADGADYGYETWKSSEGISSYYSSTEKDGSGPTMSIRDSQQGFHSMPDKPLLTASIEVPSSVELRELVADKISSHKDELMSTLMESLHCKDEEIDSLRTQIMKLEKQFRAKNAEFEDRDFHLSLIENSNHDGSMIWKIPQFMQRKADAENGKYTSIFSLPFYSGRYGYKMCLRLYIMGDGIGKGTHLSLFFVVMRGEFDNILQWPFTHKVTFKLINQAGGRHIVDTFQPDPMSSSFRKPKSDMNIASGSPRFVSHTELERGGFIVDDTIFIKCTIDTSTIYHP